LSLILDALKRLEKRLDRGAPLRPSGVGQIAEILKPDILVRGKETPGPITYLENAFLHICEMISAHSEPREVLREIVKDCLSCVRAHRATIFLIDDKRERLRENLKFISSFGPNLGEIYREEEEAIALESFEQNKPFLLHEEEIYARYPGKGPDREKFTAIMTFPLTSRNQPIGILSAVLFNGRHAFDERTLQQLSGFARLASIVVEMDDLLREVRQGSKWRRDFEKYVDRILSRLGTAPSSGEEG
jgi:GAF domain-containing protein